MTRKGLAVLLIALLALMACEGKTTPKGEAGKKTLQTPKDKVSYAIGLNAAKSFKSQGIEIDAEALTKGLQDGISGAKPLMTEEEMRTTMTTFQTEMRQKLMQAKMAAAAENKKKEDAFLEANKKKEGVVTTPSGLQYKILKEGKGKKPGDNDMVDVNYKGTLIDGKEFDSSYRRGKAQTFKVGELIPGWREALKMMPEGSKWQVFVPSKLAYGEHGAGKEIDPYSTLIFEMELVAIKPATDAKAPGAPKAPQPAAPKNAVPAKK